MQNHGNAIGSTDETKTGVTFIYIQDAISERIFLENMVYPQPPTKIQIYNTTTDDFVSGTLK